MSNVTTNHVKENDNALNIYEITMQQRFTTLEMLLSVSNQPESFQLANSTSKAPIIDYIGLNTLRIYDINKYLEHLESETDIVYNLLQTALNSGYPSNKKVRVENSRIGRYYRIYECGYNRDKVKLCIMFSHVSMYKDGLNKIPLSKWNSFCDAVNELVGEVGVFDEWVHYARNKLNRVPETLAELLKEKNNWKLMTPGDTLFHMYEDGGEYNLKFISVDGKFEVVFKPERITQLVKLKKLLITANPVDSVKWQAVLDSIFDDMENKPQTWVQNNSELDMGTYNYCSSVVSTTVHKTLDVDTFINWGNTPSTADKDDWWYPHMAENLIQKYEPNENTQNIRQSLKEKYELFVVDASGWASLANGYILGVATIDEFFASVSEFLIENTV